MSEEYFDDQTLFKVHEALSKIGLGALQVREAITEMQNAGILFRELPKDDDGVAVYRSKIVEIEAVRLPTEEEFDALSEKDAEERLRLVGQWIINNDGDAYFGKRHLTIATLEGDMVAGPGWWIIRGTAGEFYPCRDDVFQTKYEKVN